MVYRQTARSEQVRSATRTRILTAARRLFARRGYTATSMRGIAEAAHSSIGNLYFYFANKEQLLETLELEARERVWDWALAAGAALPAGGARLALIIYANSHRLLDVDRDLAHLVMVEGGPPGLAERAAAAHRELIRSILCANFPDYPERDVELFLTVWTGSVRTCYQRCVRGQLKEEPIVVAEFCARWNLRALGLPEAEIDEAVRLAAGAIRGEGSIPPFPRGGSRQPARVRRRLGS